jgi:hypothetical protein
MLGIKLTTAMAALIFILGAQLAVGKRVDGATTCKGLSASLNFFAPSGASIVLAQNDKTASEDNEKSTSGSETEKSEAAADEKNKPSEAKSKPLKPFVPSEKIPGEQAVDFPVDI